MADGSQTAVSKADKAAKDVLTLPSGAVVNLQRLDIMACRSQEDCLVLGAMLDHKIANLEHQLERFRGGFHHNGAPITLDSPADASWEGRAAYALQATKIQHGQVARRLRHFEAAEVNAFAVRFVEVAKAHLSPGTYEAVERRARETIGATT